MSETIIRAVDVSKRFRIEKDKSLKEKIVLKRAHRVPPQDFWALRDVNFELAAGATLGLVGHNGSGKSTLLKMIGGILTPTTGYVERRGRVAALLELGAGFHPDLSGRENVYLNASILGLTRAQTARYFDEIVAFSGLEDQFIDTQVKFYSSGMYVRLAFAVAVHVDPEILLVDEVLAVGDEMFQRKCLEKIKTFQREGRTICFVTHSLDQTRDLCDRVLLLEHGKVLIDGSPTDAIRAFRERNAEDEPDEVEAPPESPDGSTTGELTISRVEVVGGKVYKPGDDVTIDVTVQAHQPVPAWVCGIELRNQVDALVYGTNTDLLGQTLPSLGSAPRTLRFTLPQVPMTEGVYALTVAVHPPGATREFHRLDRVTSFSVHAETDQTGVVYVRSRVEALPEEPAVAGDAA